MKIDLTKVIEAKNVAGPLAAIKGNGWSWEYSGAPQPMFNREPGLSFLTAMFPPGAAIPVTDNLQPPLPALLAFDVTGLNPTVDGVIFESGGATSGAAIYAQSGQLIARCGPGGAIGSDANIAYANVPCPSGTGAMVIEFASGIVRVWWNGDLILANESFSTNVAWTGIDAAGFLSIQSEIVIGTPGIAFTGYDTISPLRIYKNRIALRKDNELILMLDSPGEFNLGYTVSDRTKNSITLQGSTTRNHFSWNIGAIPRFARVHYDLNRPVSAAYWLRSSNEARLFTSTTYINNSAVGQSLGQYFYNINVPNETHIYFGFLTNNGSAQLEVTNFQLVKPGM